MNFHNTLENPDERPFYDPTTRLSSDFVVVWVYCVGSRERR
jgi:hypothetical protein